MKKTDSREKKVWAKPKLIVLDYNKTYEGPFKDTDEVGSYHS